MSEVSPRDLMGALEKKGFVRDPQKTNHHSYRLYVGGRKTKIATLVSHSRAPYRERLVSAVAKQMKLTKRDLLRFVACDLTGDQYLQQLLRDGHVSL